MNKLFDSYSWKFNVTGLGGERTTDHLSKYGNGTATMKACVPEDFCAPCGK